MDEVIASDIKTTSREFVDAGPFVYADVQDSDSLARIVLEHGVDYIVHLASLLSGEGTPLFCGRVRVAFLRSLWSFTYQHMSWVICSGFSEECLLMGL